MGKLLVMTKRARQLGREAWDKKNQSIALPLAVDLDSQAQEVYEQFRNSLVEGWNEAKMEEWRSNVSMGFPFIAGVYHGNLTWNYIYLSPPPPPEVGWKVVHREAS